MINIGVVGLNPGNGHPYSFSSIFNGYDPEALEKDCDYPIIREYLSKHHGNREEYISDARITHLWAPEDGAVARVARVAKIPYISSTLEEMVDAVDAILFTRDDIWNHWDMAGELFKTGKPIYMDKVLADTPENLAKFIEAAGRDYPLMTASSFRYAPVIADARKNLPLDKIMTIRGMSPCIWVRYAPHLLDALFELYGREVEYVQNCGRDEADTVCLTYRNGVQAVLQVFNGISLPLGLEVHFPAGMTPVPLPYTDPTLESYFLSIARMMQAFADMAVNNSRPVSFAETVHLNRVVLAGIASRESGGRRIKMSEFYPELQAAAGGVFE